MPNLEQILELYGDGEGLQYWQTNGKTTFNFIDKNFQNVDVENKIELFGDILEKLTLKEQYLIGMIDEDAIIEWYVNAESIDNSDTYDRNTI